MRFNPSAEELFEPAIIVPVSPPSFKQDWGSTLFRSRREERRPLLFDLRTTTLGALDLAP